MPQPRKRCGYCLTLNYPATRTCINTECRADFTSKHYKHTFPPGTTQTQTQTQTSTGTGTGTRTAKRKREDGTTSPTPSPSPSPSLSPSVPTATPTPTPPPPPPKKAASRSKKSKKHVPIPNTDASDDPNDDTCSVCGDRGVLICCDICPLSYHVDCAGLSNGEVPEGEWKCPQCILREQAQVRGTTRANGKVTTSHTNGKTKGNANGNENATVSTSCNWEVSSDAFHLSLDAKLAGQKPITSQIDDFPIHAYKKPSSFASTTDPSFAASSSSSS